MPAKKRGLAPPASSKSLAAAASAAASQSNALNDVSPELSAQKRRRSARVQQKQDLENLVQQSKAGAPSRAVTPSSKTPSTSRSADPKPATQPKHPKASKKQAKKAVTTTGEASTTPSTAKGAAHPSPATGATAQTDVHVQLAVPNPGDRASTSDSPPSSGSTPYYWLLKAEPESRIEKGKDVKFSIDDLAACKEPAGWDGVRNYAARNNLRAMKKGDLAFFYHSNCKVGAIVRTARISKVNNYFNISSRSFVLPFQLLTHRDGGYRNLVLLESWR